MADVGEFPADLKPGDRIVTADGGLGPRVIAVRVISPNLVDVVTHLRVGGPRGPRFVLHWPADERVDIVRV
jgi:hypothetical protein